MPVFFADYPQSYETIWVKVKMALYSSAGRLVESTRFPGSSGRYNILINTYIMNVLAYTKNNCKLFTLLDTYRQLHNSTLKL